MKISEVLRKAKPELKKTKYVCYAIEDCLATTQAKNKAKKYVAKLIQPWGSVSSWLIRQAKINALDINEDTLQEYRERWIDHMIQELEKEGK